MKKVFLVLAGFLLANLSFGQCDLDYSPEESNTYYVKFTSICDLESQLPLNLNINGKTFSNAGRWFDGVFNYSWTNNSGTPIDKDNFILGDTGFEVQNGKSFNSATLGMGDFSFEKIKYQEIDFKVFTLSGRFIGDSLEGLSPGIYIVISEENIPFKILIQ